MPFVRVTNPATLIAVGALVAYTWASGSPNQAAAGFGEPVAKTADGRLVYSRGGRLYVAGKGPGAFGDPIAVRVGGGGPIVLYEFQSDVVAPGEGRPPAPSAPPRPTGGGNKPAKPTTTTKARRTDLDFQLELDAARRTPSDADELRLLRRRDTFLEGVIGRLEADTTKTKAQKEQLARFYNEEAAIQGQIDSIIKAREDARDRIQNERRRKAEERARKREQAARAAAKILTAQQNAADAAAQKEWSRYGWGAAAAYAKRGKPTSGPGSTSSTAAEAMMSSREWAQYFRELFSGLIGDFASNVYRREGSAPRPPVEITVNTNAPATPGLARELTYAATAMHGRFDG